MDNILGDGQFEPLQGEVAALGIRLNTTSHDEHVPEVEQYFCTLMERVRACYNTLLFEKYPHWLIIEMVYTQKFLVECFPTHGRDLTDDESKGNHYGVQS